MMLATSGQFRLAATNTVGVVVASKTVNRAFSLDDGTANGQANAFYYGTISVAAGATAGANTATLSLATIANALLGGSSGFSAIKALTLSNTSTTSSVTLQPTGGATQWPYVASMTLAPGAAVALYSPAGWTVGSTPTIRVANLDTTTTVTGTTMANSTTVSGISSTSGIVVGQQLTGTGIATGTTVSAVTSTGLTLSTPATTSGTASLTAAWPDAVVEASIVGTLI